MSKTKKLNLRSRSLISYFIFTVLVFQQVHGDIDLATSGKLSCSSTSSNFGTSVKAIGDVNGDEIADFIVGMPGYDNNKGAIAIIYGSSSGIPSVDVCSDSFTTKDGYIIKSESTAAGSKFGSSLSGVGDINKDGIEDIVVGAPYYTSGAISSVGRAYIILLPETPSSKSFSIDSLTTPMTSTAGSYYTLTGVSIMTYIGSFVTGVGDVNNDGVPDVLVGAPSGNGAAYILYGKMDATNLDISNIAATDGYTILGDFGEMLGYGASGCSDINGDGIPDMFISAVYRQRLYLLYGKEGTDRTSITAPLTATDGVMLTDPSTFGLAQTISCGDIDGDGKVDAVIGLLTYGRVYVLFGSFLTTLPTYGTFDFSSLTPEQGFAIDGDTNYFGQYVSAAGDVNGDGIADIVLTYENYSPTGSSPYYGAAYVIYGNKAGLASFSISTLTSSQGYRIVGPAESRLGSSIDTSKDINGDGVNDIIIGASSEKSTYIVYGTCGLPGYYLDKTCTECSPVCATCTANTTCQTCIANYALTNNYCNYI